MRGNPLTAAMVAERARIPRATLRAARGQVDRPVANPFKR
jgi:hypothetical protein